MLDGKNISKYYSFSLVGIIILTFSLFIANTFAESSRLMPVVPDHKLTFPHDYGAHQDFRIEWWRSEERRVGKECCR